MVCKMWALKRINHFLWCHISYKENAVLERMLKILCSLSYLELLLNIVFLVYVQPK